MGKKYTFKLELENGKEIVGICHVKHGEDVLNKIRSSAESLYGQKANITSVD